MLPSRLRETSQHLLITIESDGGRNVKTIELKVASLAILSVRTLCSLCLRGESLIDIDTVVTWRLLHEDAVEL
jgi:hypothetical protein